MNACEAMLQLLADAGVKYLFGNPGTTELPLSDALVDFTRIKYILGLQEVPVMAMADGYAQASRSPGVVNVHISCGLGNAMGMLYNAYRGDAADPHRRPARPSPQIRGADPLVGHGPRREALDEVGRRGGAGRRACRWPFDGPYKPR